MDINYDSENNIMRRLRPDVRLSLNRDELHAFKVLPKRWIVERNFAWMGWSRRLSKDYELLPTTSETMLWISSAHTMLKQTT